MGVVMRLPDLATNATAITVVRWLVDVGQPVRRGQPLVEVETDKAVMEVESVVTGILQSIAVAPGEQADVGQVIAVFDAPEIAGARSAEVSSPAPATVSHAGGAQGYEAVAYGSDSVHQDRNQAASPSALATSERVSFFARNRQARGTSSTSVPSQRGLPVTAPRRALVRRMRESKQNIPHFYLQTSANAEPMAIYREKSSELGAKIVWDAFFVKALARTLKRFDRMAYRFEEDRLTPQGVDAVGVAVDVDDELFTVVVDGPAAKSLEQISTEIRAGVDRLRSGDPRARVSQPAVLTVSNLGRANVESFTAIINPPESAILAVGKIMPQPAICGGSILIQSRVNLTLSVDHRVVNGKYAAGFLGGLVEEIEAF